MSDDFVKDGTVWETGRALSVQYVLSNRHQQDELAVLSITTFVRMIDRPHRPSHRPTRSYTTLAVGPVPRSPYPNLPDRPRPARDSVLSSPGSCTAGPVRLQLTLTLRTDVPLAPRTNRDGLPRGSERPRFGDRSTGLTPGRPVGSTGVWVSRGSRGICMSRPWGMDT